MTSLKKMSYPRPAYIQVRLRFAVHQISINVAKTSGSRTLDMFQIAKSMAAMIVVFDSNTVCPALYPIHLCSPFSMISS